MKLRIIGAMMVAALFVGPIAAQAPLPAATAAEVPQSPVPSIVGNDTPKTAEFFPIGAVWPATTPASFCWVTAECTLNWISGNSLPPLVTTSSTGVALADAGVLGRSTTNVLLGYDSLSPATTNGMKFGAGMTSADNMRYELLGFYMQNGPEKFALASDGGTAIIARPFFEPITNQEAANVVAFPGRFAGSVAASFETQFWGIEGNIYDLFRPTPSLTVGGGFRYLNLTDGLKIQQRTTAVSLPPLSFSNSLVPLDNTLQINDSFRTRNEFIGPQVCVRYEQDMGAVFWGVTAKLAAGINNQSVEITGSTQLLALNGQQLERSDGGFLAVASNSGRHTRKVLSVVPELNFNVGYNLSENVRLMAGYDFLYCANVVRPGEQIDRRINLTKVPAAAVFDPDFGAPDNPFPQLWNTDLIVNSLRIGFELRY